MRNYEETFVDTMSAISCTNGVVRMMFVGQDLRKSALLKGDEKVVPEAELVQVLTMPVPGFLYMVNVVKNMMDEPRMAELLAKMEEAGLLGKATPEKQVEP